MKIGVIGIGNVGGQIAKKLARKGHNVLVANSRGVDGVAEFAAKIGATPVDIRDTLVGTEAVFLAIPFFAIAELPKGLFDALPASVPLVDTSNYAPNFRDPNVEEIDAGMPESVWVSKLLGRPVIKAYNTQRSYTLAELGRPEDAEDRLALPVSGDDIVSKKLIMDLVNETGFDPVDGGTLAESWRQEPFTPVFANDYAVEDTRRALVAAVRGKARPMFDAASAAQAAMPEDATHADIIKMSRNLNPLQ